MKITKPQIIYDKRNYEEITKEIEEENKNHTRVCRNILKTALASTVATIIYFVYFFKRLDDFRIGGIMFILWVLTLGAYLFWFLELTSLPKQTISDHLELSHSLKDKTILAVESKDFESQDVYLITEDKKHVVEKFDISYLKRIARTDFEPDKLVVDLNEFAILYSYNLCK